jgi:hypothetical protein
MPNHKCVFDSAQGYLPERFGLSLRCACGRWGMPARGRWLVFTSARTHLGCKRRLDAASAAFAAIIVLLFLWLA